MSHLLISECKYIDKRTQANLWNDFNIKFSTRDVLEADSMFRNEFVVNKAVNHILSNVFRKDFRFERKNQAHKKGSNKRKRTTTVDGDNGDVLSRLSQFAQRTWTWALREACAHLLIYGFALCRVEEGSPLICFVDPCLYDISCRESTSSTMSGFEYACSQARTSNLFAAQSPQGEESKKKKAIQYYLFISDHPKTRGAANQAHLTSPTLVLREAYQVNKIATAAYMKAIQRRAVPPYVVRVPQLSTNELSGTIPLTSPDNHTSAMRDRIESANRQQNENASDIVQEIVRTMASQGLRSEADLLNVYRQKMRREGKQEIDYFQDPSAEYYKIESMRPDAEAQMVTLTAGATLETAPTPEVPGEFSDIRQSFEDRGSLVFEIPPAVFSRTLDSAKKGGGITHGQLAQANYNKTIDKHKNRVKKMVTYLFYAVFGQYYMEGVFFEKARARLKSGKKTKEGESEKSDNVKKETDSKTKKKNKIETVDDFLDQYELDTSACEPSENEIEVVFPSDVSLAHALVMIDAGVFGHKEKVQLFVDIFGMEESQFPAEDPALSAAVAGQGGPFNSARKRKSSSSSSTSKDKDRVVKKSKVNPATTESEYRSERNMEPKIQMKR